MAELRICPAERCAARARYPVHRARRTRHDHGRVRAEGHRAYASAIDRTIAEVGGADRLLAEVSDHEIGEALLALWGGYTAATWNRNRAAVSSWLTWCRTKKRWVAPSVPSDAERRRENVDETKAVGKAKIERLLSRRDLPLRERTLCPGIRPRGSIEPWLSVRLITASGVDITEGIFRAGVRRTAH
ncbi:hypothetical protein OG589_14055 [Sphaerisporangium sp. NBC_01403]|uniref:hypothetical protein n=1 Tax=Sphaerisporangium sp. NBC_01403 TaxID=2903599 RepID=UPI00324C629B